MPDNLNVIVEYGELLVAAALAVSTTTLGILNYRRSGRIRELEAQAEHLKRRIHKVSSKVDPEADRKLVLSAESSIEILGINSLGPLHHCREEIMEFLMKRAGLLRVVLLDPQSPEFKTRERKELDNSSRLLSEWRASVSIMRDIQQHSQGNIELRLRPDAPDRSLLIVDASPSLNDRSSMLINYYPDEPGMRGYSGSQYLAEFTMERDRDSMFKNRNFYNEVWCGARTVTLEGALQLATERSGS